MCVREGTRRMNQRGKEEKHGRSKKIARTHMRYCHGEGPFQLEGGDTDPTSPYPDEGPSPLFFT